MKALKPNDTRYDHENLIRDIIQTSVSDFP